MRKIKMSEEERDFLSGNAEPENAPGDIDMEELGADLEEAVDSLEILDAIIQDELESANLSERGKIEELYCTKIDLLYYLARAMDVFTAGGKTILMDAKNTRQEFEQMVAPLSSVITARNMKIFAPLLTWDIVEEILAGKCDAYGAIRGSNDKTYGAGVIVYYMDADPLTQGSVIIRIKWLNVAEKFRQKGICNFLIGTLMSQLTDLSVSAVTVDIPALNSYSEVLGNTFGKWGFYFATGTTPEFTAEIDDIDGTEMLGKYAKGAQSFVKSGVDDIIIQRYLKKSVYQGYLNRGGLPKGYFDAELSFYLGEWNRANGMLLAHVSPSKTVKVELLDVYGDDPEKIKCLVSAFLIKALEKCESGTKVVIPVESPELGELLDKVCPVSVGEYLLEGILSA